MFWPARTKCIQMQIIPKNACNLPCLCLETQHKFQAASISEKAIAMQALEAIFKYWSELKMCLACCIPVSLLRCSKTLSNDLVQHASWQDHVGLSENRVYSQWNSHLIGIMISKTIGYNGVHYFQTHPCLMFNSFFHGSLPRRPEASTTCHDHIPYTAISPQPMAPQLELHGWTALR